MPILPENTSLNKAAVLMEDQSLGTVRTQVLLNKVRKFWSLEISYSRIYRDKFNNSFKHALVHLKFIWGATVQVMKHTEAY